MTDYVGALKKGLKAAKAADYARKEIDEVFVELDRQIREGMNGKISIDRREYEETDPKWSKSMDSIFAIPPKVKYWAIVVHNRTVEKSPVIELARWKQDRAGFPCNISWGERDRHCFDRRALENALAELLQDPLVGKELYALMRLGDNAEEALGTDETPDEGTGNAV